MLFRAILTGAAVLTAAGILSAPHAQATTTITAGSSSNALSALITVSGKSFSLPNQAVASGTAPPKYSKTIAPTGTYTKTQTANGLTLSVTAKNIKDTASSAGLDAKGGITAISGASIGPFTSTLTYSGNTVLTVGATNLTSGASFAETKAGATTATGSTSITALTINSSLFGLKNLTYSGKPQSNFVLYQSKDKTVTVYLNRQIPKSAGGKATSITASAVNLHVVNYKYAIYTISGDINVATSNAN